MEKTSCIPKEPFVKLGSGQAPTLDYNLPQETCFSIYGRRRVPVNAKDFLKSASQEPEDHYWKQKPVVKADDLVLRLEGGVQISGIGRNPQLLASMPVTTAPAGSTKTQASASKKAVNPPMRATESNPSVSPQEIAPVILSPVVTQASGTKAVVPQYSGLDTNLLVQSINEGLMPSIYRSFGGAPRVLLVEQPKKPVPKLFVVEEYKVCSYLGDYGAGKTVKTFTLLPGEKTTIAVSSYTDREETKSYSENILDSFSQTAADSFEQTLNEESGTTTSATTSSSVTDTDTFGGKLNLGIDILIAEIGASGEASSTNTTEASASTTRDNYTKNINSAVEKHATTSNSNREVEVNTTTSATVTSGTSTSTTRELQNINHSRVLNFVFRQLLQEYITITFLKDVRFVFTNGYPESTRVVDIPDLKPFLRTIMVEDKVKEVFNQLMKPYCKVYNYEGKRFSFIEKVVEDYGDCPFAEPGEKVVYWRKRSDLTDTYEGFKVDGIILKTQQNILRTDSLIADSLLGQGEALDCYNQSLQEAAVEKALLDNRKTDQALAIVGEGADAVAKADAYARVFGICCDDEEESETAAGSV
jgi:hypothetical protein